MCSYLSPQFKYMVFHVFICNLPTNLLKLCFQLTLAKLMKNTCSFVSIIPGSLGSSQCSLTHFRYAYEHRISKKCLEKQLYYVNVWPLELSCFPL